jgi:hypothetical protein
MSITDPEILPVVTTTVPYNYTFHATGGNGPLVWSQGGLPPGLTLSPTGSLTGTHSSPSQGLIAFIVAVTDGVTTFQRRFSLYIASTRVPQLSLAPQTTPLADFIVGSAGAFVLPTPGGGTPPYTWSLAPGSTLPPGMALASGSHLTPTFNPGQTILVGSPTTVGAFVFDLVATDATGAQMVRTFTINVSNIALLGAVRVPVAGTPYAQQFTTAGGTLPYTYSMTPFSADVPMLPPGLSLSATGLLAGTATSTGLYQFRLRVADAVGNTFSRNFSFNVTTASGLRILTNGFGDLTLGGSVEEGLSLVGNPAPSSVNWSHVGGTLPPGVNLVSDSLIGRPTATGTYTFTLRGADASNPSNFADREFRIRVVPMQVVSPPMRFGWTELPAGHTGQAYSTTIKMAGGAPPYTFAVNSLLPLPAGLTLSAAGVLSGTPLQTGGYEIGFDVSDSAGNTATIDDLSLAITSVGVPRPLVRDDGFLGFASRGVEFGSNIGGVDFAVRGGVKPFTWSLTPGFSLPPGLSLLSGGNGVSDMLVGVPTQPGQFDFSLDVLDAAGQRLTVPVELPVFDLSIRPHTIPNGMVGSPYSATLIPSGGVAPYSMQLTEYSDLPPGLTFSPSGVLSGIPTTAGNFFVAVRVFDSGVSSMDFGYRVTVDNAAGEAKPVRISPYPIQVTHVQGSPISPTAVNVNSSSGVPFTAVISGIPGASLQSTTGTTPTNIALNLGLGSLGLGTYNGFVGIAAPSAANLYDTVPITVNVVAAPPCAYAVTPTAGSVASGFSGGSFSVATGPGCNWTATKSATWITIAAGASGTGPGNVSYFVTANPSPTARQGNITVNGAVYSITQFGTSCSFAINPTVINAPFSGGSAVIAVTASSAACAWTASGLNATPAGGTGNGSVNVIIPPNGLPGMVVLNATIAGQALTVNQTGVGCTVSLGSSAASVPAAGGPSVVQVTAPVGCNYSTVTGPSWITVTSGGSGNGNGTAAPLHFDVGANSTTLPRSGSLTIGGQTFQIDQAGLACSVTVDTSGLGSPYGPAGGVGLVGVTTNGSNCTWSASSAVNFASVSPQSGTGNGSVAVTLASNAGSAAGRSATLTIGGQVVQFLQSGTTCTYGLQSTDGTVPASGGSGAVGVVSPAVCTWNAISNSPPWLSITSAGGAGSSNVQFVAQANTSAASRQGSLTVAGQTYTVRQAGAPCSYALNTSNVTVASSGLTTSMSFSTAATGCSPTAVSYASWITGVGTTFNGSSGTVNFTVDPSPFTATRKGTIQVGDQTFTITQSGGSCGYSLNAYGALFSNAGGTGSVLGSPTALGCVPATGTAEPNVLTLSPLVGPVGNIFTQDYTVAPYPNVLTPVVRKGYIVFGGQIFTVKQTSW